jgi:xanthine dehydrogenase accessory factor
MAAEFFNHILQALERNQACVAATVVACGGSAPRHIGAKMVVSSEGLVAGTTGGGALEKRVLNDAICALRRKKSYLKTYSLNKKDGLQVCGGRVSIFIEVIAPQETLVICGGGHIGLALSGIAKLLRFRVVVFDNRRAFANAKRFSHADQVVCGAYPELLGKFPADAKTSIVIVTHGHVHDAACLEAALKTKAGYIGMIGSKTKIEFVFKDLKIKGFAAKRLEQVHAPIGLDIGAETPEEIAVAIAAEMIQVSKK